MLGDKPLGDYLDPTESGVWHDLRVQDSPGKMYELAVQPLLARQNSGGWVLVLRDVTQERENQTRIQIQERLATVGQLAAGIAHDFNNILAAIVVYADLLKRDPSLPSASRERLAIIHQQVQRAASLIRQILDFSRRSMMEHSTLDVLPFLKELDKLLRRLLPETIRVELRYRPGRYQVVADPTRLQQVFMNLAVNARDAMPVGGVLHFEMARLVITPKTHPCPNLHPGHWIRISVSDTGFGIAPDVLPHIFEPFFTTKPIGQGTGLGLAQAYGIIKQHGGHIEVESRPGEGTTFHVFLPALEASDQYELLPEQTLELDGEGETILVVEDDAVARQAMSDLLKAYNYRVLVAADGVEALDLFNQRWEDIALVVSDIVMPEMGGVDLYYALRQRWPQVKMLFVTGHPLREQDQAILERGEVNWLQKPYAIQTFHETIRQLINGSE
jgi:signal transduction histidine kinase/CheY-like chemotaxis protein